MSILASRISDLDDFVYSYDDIAIEYDDIKEAIKKIQNYKLSKVGFEKEKSIDVSDMNSDEVRVWLKELPVLNIKIDAYWVSFEEGINLYYYDFIKDYNELWYPGTDDIWITEGSFAWLIELNHEEVISFWIKSSSVR